MKTSYEMEIAGLKRSLPLCSVTEDLYIAAFIMFGDVEVTVACAKELLSKAPEFDVLMTAEAKGIPLVCEMARQAGTNKYIVARKGPKVYMKEVVTVDVNSITTAHAQKLSIDAKDAEYLKGKRVLIIDDVISTGESLAALESLANASGAIIAGKMAVLAEGGAADREDIIYLERLPLFDKNGEVKE